MIAASAHRGIAYAERLIVGIESNDFASFARVGDRVIESNHPAFICGHLSIYPANILQNLDVDAGQIAPTDEFSRLFSHEAKCVDGRNGDVYPAMDKITDAFFAAYKVATAAIESTDDEVFLRENPNERMRTMFPTIGAMHAFYVGGHFMMHMGQWSAWRRVMGMPAA
ncbi:DinB family protein [Rubripirellula tenax]|nr:DinB family protein [Rubripirellula tenax]